METWKVILLVVGSLIAQRYYLKWRTRRRLARIGQLPKQDFASMTKAQSDAAGVVMDLQYRAEEVRDATPEINADVVDQSRKLGYALYDWDIPRLFWVLDALSLKVLIVNKAQWEKAVRILKDAGVGMLSIFLLLSIATTKTTLQDAHSAYGAVKTEANKLRSFLLSIFW